MDQYHEKSLPAVFDDFFKPVNKVYSHNTRLASRSSLYTPQITTNYGKFNLRYLGVKIWVSDDEKNKILNKRQFKL